MAKATLDLEFRSTGEPWKITFVSDLHTYLMSARLRPGARYKNAVVSFPLDPHIVYELEQEIPNLKITPRLRNWLNALETTKLTLTAIKNGSAKRTAVDLPYGNKLYPYQVTGVDWMVNAKRCILADEPGLGKTIQALAAADLTAANKVLIFTVNTAVQNQWQKHIQDWNLGSYTNVQGTKARRINALNNNTRFYIFPISTLSSTDIAYKNFFKQHFDVIIVDEAHTLQNRESARGKAASRLKSDYLFLLTGTPIWNNIASIWNLLHLINKNRWSSYWAWINENFVTWKNGFGTQIGKPRPDKYEQIKADLSDVLLRRELQDVFSEFPEAKHMEIPLTMPDTLKTAYKELKLDLLNYKTTKIGNKEYRITSPAVVIPILRAVLNNPKLINTPVSLPDTKTDYIVEAAKKITTGNKQLLIFTWHTSYADKLAAVLNSIGIETRTIHGKMAPGIRLDNLEKYKAKRFPVLVATMASLGVGVDLPDVEVLLFAEVDWTPAVIEQSWRRIYRVSSRTTKAIIFIYYKGTIEENIFNIFQKKQFISDELLGTQALEDKNEDAT